MAFTKHAPPRTAPDEPKARDCPQLINDLASDTSAVRRTAARELSAWPEAIPALLARLAVERETSVRANLFTTLARLGGPIAVAGLSEFLRSEDAGLRNEAIGALQALPDDVAPLMEALLADPEADVRIMAINVLEALQHPSVEAWLIAVIERDAEVNVCGTAVDLLCEIGSPLAREPLSRLKVRFAHEPYLQFAAQLALKRISQLSVSP